MQPKNGAGFIFPAAGPFFPPQWRKIYPAPFFLQWRLSPGEPDSSNTIYVGNTQLRVSIKASEIQYPTPPTVFDVSRFLAYPYYKGVRPHFSTTEVSPRLRTTAEKWGLTPVRLYRLTVEWSTATPGPIVEEMVIRFRYWPFVADGFAFSTSASNAARFSFSALTSKSTFPIGQ